MVEDPSGAQAQRVIFDTDVLIWYFRGDEGARRFLTRVPYPQRALSSLSVMELLQGCRDRDEIRQVKAFVSDNLAVVLHPDEAVSRGAIGLLERHALPRGLRVIDALIAATALETGAVLATANVKHYRAVGPLRLIPFRPRP